MTRVATRSRARRAAAAILFAAVAACGGDSAPRADDTSPGGDSARGRAADTLVAGAQRGCPATSADTGVRVIRVNRGTHGMMAQTLWLASPDGCALLAMENAAAVEAEPVTNGALYVSEAGARPVVIPIDSAWDVAPDARWTRLAVGRGWVLSAGERDTVPPAKWAALARETGVDAARLEASSFNASGMAYARGVALAYELSLDAAAPTPRRVATGGWRVGWRGDTLLVGSAPSLVQDFSPATRWTMHPPPEREAIVVPATFAPPALRWAEGPLVGPGMEDDTTAKLGDPRMVELAHGVVQSRGGRISLLRPGRQARDVGPGAVLAATMGGRFIVAIAPVKTTREYEAKLRMVVYQVND